MAMFGVYDDRMCIRIYILLTLLLLYNLNYYYM